MNGRVKQAVNASLGPMRHGHACKGKRNPGGKGSRRTAVATVKEKVGKRGDKGIGKRGQYIQAWKKSPRKRTATRVWGYQ